MRSFAEIDRDHEGMNKVCVRRDHGCTYPACKCDRSQRIVPNVRGVEGPKLTPAQLADCRINPEWQVPLAECCPRCLRDGIVERESECRAHGVRVDSETQQAEYERMHSLAHAWAQECYFKGLGRPARIDETRGAFQKALRERIALGVAPSHPMRDGYTGSVLASGKEGHALIVRYARREQADAAQAWLAGETTAGVNPSDGGKAR